MSTKKDELISGSELARRLDIHPSFISKQKAKLKDAKCTFGKKFYYNKSCEFLGKDPKDPHKSRQSNLQTDVKAQKKTTPKSNKNWNITTGKIDINRKIEELQAEDEQEEKDDNQEDDAKTLLDQILKAVKGGSSSANRQQLDMLRQKAGVLREYFTAKNEEIKNRKLEENLFDKDEVTQILSFAINMVRNSLINLPNNYAVSLEGLTSKEIKDYTTDDINKILEDFQNVGNQFEG